MPINYIHISSILCVRMCTSCLMHHKCYFYYTYNTSNVLTAISPGIIVHLEFVEVLNILMRVYIYINNIYTVKYTYTHVNRYMCYCYNYKNISHDKSCVSSVGKNIKLLHIYNMFTHHIYAETFTDSYNNRMAESSI